LDSARRALPPGTLPEHGGSGFRLKRDERRKLDAPIPLDLRPNELAVSPELQNLQWRVAARDAEGDLSPQRRQLLFKIPKAKH
jgi:hypothetical protein